MRSFQVLLAGSNPATRLIFSFYLIPMLFKYSWYFFFKQKRTAACSGPSMLSQAEHTSLKYSILKEAYAFKFFYFNKQGIKGSRDQGIKGSRDQGIKGSRDQGIKAAQTFRAAWFYVIKPKSSIHYKDSKGKELLFFILSAQFFPFRLVLLSKTKA